MISAGLFTSKIDIYSPVLITDKYGDSIQEWQCIKHGLHARVQFQRGTQIVREGAGLMSGTIAVTIRDSQRWNEMQRIKWDGKIYRIDSFNRSRGEGIITISAVRIEE